MTAESASQSFFQELRSQRWDDHRYYHHSRVNQSLHLVSALSFLIAYVYLAIDPVVSALLGWCFAMVTRQVGHFFFEPKGYDAVNHATHDHKEAIKVGYNLRRKVILLSVWGLSPLLLWRDPALFGIFDPTDGHGYLHHLSVLWIAIGMGAVLARTLWLCVVHNVQRGLVWATKILTDPFHDVMLYWRSPLHLLRGEWIDPMRHAAAK